MTFDPTQFPPGVEVVTSGAEASDDRSTADEICDLIRSEFGGLRILELRIACNRIRRTLDALDPIPKAEPIIGAALERMSPREASEYGKGLMGFGQYADRQRQDVPREYLDWLVETKKSDWRNLLRYMKSFND